MLHTDNNSQQFTGNTFSQGFYEPIHIKKVVSMKVIKNSYFLIIKCFYFIKIENLPKRTHITSLYVWVRKNLVRMYSL